MLSLILLSIAAQKRYAGVYDVRWEWNAITLRKQRVSCLFCYLYPEAADQKP